jgi:hypothetical protein
MLSKSPHLGHPAFLHPNEPDQVRLAHLADDGDEVESVRVAWI